MSEDHARRLMLAAFFVTMLAVALGLGAPALASSLDAPDVACSAAIDYTECLTEYVAFRLYERHEVDIGSAAFFANAGPAALVLSLGVGMVLLVRGARLR